MAPNQAWTGPMQRVIIGTQEPKFVAVASRKPHSCILKARVVHRHSSRELPDTHKFLKNEALNDDLAPTLTCKLCHGLGLDSIYSLVQQLRGTREDEAKKVAIIEDLRSACLVSLLHILPVTASIVLSVFNWKGYYIGSELSGPSGTDGLKFLGLQFAAKMLELLAIASLSTILFAILRAQLISNTLPFGAITAGFEFTKLSLLWSREFLATCISTTFASSRQKMFLIATIVMFTMLGAVIGPSAAVAARPVLRAWPAGGTTFWLNATSQELWPQVLDDMEASDLHCNSSTSNSCFADNYNLIADGQLSLWPTSSFVSSDNGSLPNVMPETVLIAERHSIRAMASRFKGPFIYHPELTTSTVPFSAIADALSQVSRYWFMANQHQCLEESSGYCFYNDIVHTVNTIQPVTYVRCFATSTNFLSNASILVISGVCVPALVARFFACEKNSNWPLAPEIHEMNENGCCSQGYVFSRGIVGPLLDTTNLETD